MANESEYKYNLFSRSSGDMREIIIDSIIRGCTLMVKSIGQKINDDVTVYYDENPVNNEEPIKYYSEKSFSFYCISKDFYKSLKFVIASEQIFKKYSFLIDELKNKDSFSIVDSSSCYNLIYNIIKRRMEYNEILNNLDNGF